MKILLSIALALFLIFSSREILARERYIDNKYYCEKGHGVWREFGNQCGNYCSAIISDGICSPNLLMACDCEENNCWNEADQKCWNIEKYRNKVKEELEKKEAEEKRIEEEKKAEQKKIEDKKKADEQKVINDKIAADKKIADDKKAEEQKKIDDKKAEDDKKKLEEDKKTEENKKVEEKTKEEEPTKMDDNKTAPISNSTNKADGDIKIQDINDVIRDLNAPTQ